MTEEQRLLLRRSRQRLSAAIDLVGASVSRTDGFDPTRSYTPEEREPFDALCDRFVHDYAPEQLARLYADIRGPFHRELSGLAERLGSVEPGEPVT